MTEYLELKYEKNAINKSSAVCFDTSTINHSTDAFGRYIQQTHIDLRSCAANISGNRIIIGVRNLFFLVDNIRNLYNEECSYQSLGKRSL